MTGCWVAWKCFVACLLGESSQQPTWPQVRQIRKCSHTLPLSRHSSQPSALGVTLRMPLRWVQPFAILNPRRYSAGFAVSPRKPCSAATTCAPSPIAPPTRLTDPERTSPTANTPGTEVSSAGTGRPRFCSDCAPVTTKPPRSSVTPQPSSQPAAAQAPALQRAVLEALQPDHFGVEHQLDIRRGLDAFDQIARHAGPQAA